MSTVVTLPGSAAKALGLLVVLVFRPVRRPWAAVVPATVLVAMGASAAAVALGARALLSEVALALLGSRERAVPGEPRRLSGLAVVVQARRTIAGVNERPPVASEKVHEDPFSALFAAVEDLGRALVEGWASADAQRFIDEGRRAAVRLRQQWRAGSIARATLLISATGIVLVGAVRVALMVTIGTMAIVMSDASDRAPVWASACVSALTVWWMTTRSVGWLALLGGAFLLWAAPFAAIVIAALSVVARLLVQRVREFGDRRVVAGRSAAPLGRRDLGGDLSAWRAASSAAEERSGLAIAMFTQLSRESRNPGVAAAAVAEVARLELLREEYDRALRAVGEAFDILKKSPDQGWSRLRVWALSRIVDVRWSLGQGLADLVAIADDLPPSIPETVDVLSYLAESLVDAGDPSRAVALLDSAQSAAVSRSDMVSIYRCEVAIAGVLLSQGQTEAAVARLGNVDMFIEEIESRRAHVETSGRTSLLLGRIALAANRTEEAMAALRAATTRLVNAPAAMRARAWVLTGTAHADAREWENAVSAVSRGVALLDRPRQRISFGPARARAFISERALYSSALDTLVAAARAGEHLAGSVALRLVESLHRSALASVLREGRLALPDDVVAILDRIETLEQELLTNPTAGTERSTDPDPTGPALAAERDRLAASLSGVFASAYLPQEVDLVQIQKDAGDAHLLSYFFPSGDSRNPGYAVWLPPGERAEVFTVSLTGDSDAEDLLRYLMGQAESKPLALMRPWRASATLFTWLAEQLLPERLRDVLAESPSVRSLVISPGQALSRFPFAALDVRGQPLISLSTVQVTASFDQLRGSTQRFRASKVIFHGDPDVLARDTGLSTEPPPPSGVEYVVARDYESIQRLLDSQDCDGVYLAVHGNGYGLEQYLSLGDGRTLSAAQALRYRWPPWVLFASCFVGGVQHVPGAEPLGLPIACLLGGAHVVIAGVVEVGGAEAPALANALLAAIARGEHPAAALRSAQLRSRSAPPEDWAFYACVSRTAA